MKRSFITFLTMMFILSIFHLTVVSAADVPKTLNYQGDLTDNTGQPVSGTKSIKFSLYDVVSGGTALWTETQTVSLTNGHFSVVLGNSTPLATDLFTGESFLGIKVGADAEMTPRQKFTSVPYALHAGSVSQIPPINAPEGFLLNGKIAPSAASGNLTVALKTLAGNDPSVSDPVYCRIGDTVRSITAALSVTINAGTNWLNAGSTELATNEIDYFVYLSYEDDASAIRVGFSRYPGANLFSDFSATTTNAKGSLWNNNPDDVNTVELIGRFAATLSGGPGYTWSVPTFTASNLIQRPIYETRYLQWLPSVVLDYSDDGSGGQPAMAGKYKLRGSSLYCVFGKAGGWYKNGAGTIIVFATNSMPFSISSPNYVTLGVFTSEFQNAKVGTVRTQSGLKFYIDMSASVPDNTELYGFANAIYEISN